MFPIPKLSAYGVIMSDGLNRARILNRKAAVLYNDVSDKSSQDELDVLVQVDSVTKALASLSYDPVPVPLSLDLQGAIESLKSLQPVFVFNLVESIAGIGRFIHFAPAILDHLKLSYTGASTKALFITTDKLLTKERLKAAGLPTPAWLSAAGLEGGGLHFGPPYIIKPVCEDASVGLDEDAFFHEGQLLREALKERSARYGECFIEEYIHGREFNLSVLAGKDGPEVLPPAEIQFADYPPDKPRIVGYRAKWEAGSFEYTHTVRRFNFPEEDQSLVRSLSRTALQCWDLFQLRGYARVDFRVDDDDTTWVLEINANPCISPDSGFVAASQQAELTFEQVVQRIIGDSLPQ
jgi:D-alanine-D-alanine ligase